MRREREPAMGLRRQPAPLPFVWRIWPATRPDDLLMAAEPHITASGIEPNEEGWFIPRCQCGWKWIACPDAETAADALMEHAYEQGYAAAMRDVVAMSPGEQAKP